ncbi:MAG: DHA2 family efflux MFS transporter permease subunit [Acidimicrobiia bacterium]
MTTPHPTPPPGVDYRNRYWVLLAIGMGIFLGTIDGSIVNAALPTLVEELDTGFASVQWVVLAYLLTQATLVLSIGRLGDMIGKKRIYTAGFGLFTVGSVLAGLAPGVELLVMFRILQAIGSAMIFALGFAIVTEAFPPSERGRALGINGAVVSVGIAIGPALGGILIESLSWRWIFFVNLPVGIIGIWTAHRFIPDTPPPGKQRFDFPGAAAFFFGLLALMLALTLGQDVGFASPAILALFATALAGLVTFVLIELRVLQPMLDLTLFRNRLLTINLITGWMVFVGIAGLIFLLPFYLQQVLGYGPRALGLLLGIAPVALGVVAPISGALSDRIGQRPVIVVGLAVLVVGYLVAATLNETSTIPHFAAAAVPIGVGIGVFQSPNNSAVMGSVPRERLGVMSGSLTITRIVGQLSGIAILGTLWAARVGGSGGGSDPTSAPATAQVTGLRQTMLVIAALSLVALVLALWSAATDRQRVGTGAAAPPGVVPPGDGP